MERSGHGLVIENDASATKNISSGLSEVSIDEPVGLVEGMLGESAS